MLKPKCDGPLSNFAFKFKLRHYTKGRAVMIGAIEKSKLAGAYTRPLFSST